MPTKGLCQPIKYSMMPGFEVRREDKWLTSKYSL